MARILVTGGAGFLGGYLCEALLSDGHRVICVDNFGSGQYENVEHLRDNDRFEIKELDIRETNSFPDADRIFHLASRASPKDFTEYPVQIALTNTIGTRNVLEHATRCGARVLYASTSEVYGEPEVHPQPETYNGNVNIRGPRGCYDESKRFGETLTVAYEKEYDVDVRTVRIFNTYGPQMRPDDGRVVPTFVTQALQGNDLTVYGDGTQTRSFCYVSDMIAGLRTFMRTDGFQGDVLNMGNDNEISIETLAETIIELTGTESSIQYMPLPDDDPSRRQPDLEKTRYKLDWEPAVSLEEGLRKTLEYYRDS
ncbi:UDP-glucuronic acid decarboxylase family protein [Haloarcula marina]|uniref:UDP-glucuronic acid decarboxylase family protein n=1 Tax=Haloarcula marina TaxID=2961574 RepID=UPI0020B856CC|nr:UDP-glucuronic acid decarboxylase family protein [Halomicroarcula marina]